MEFDVLNRAFGSYRDAQIICFVKGYAPLLPLVNIHKQLVLNESFLIYVTENLIFSPHNVTTSFRCITQAARFVTAGTLG